VPAPIRAASQVDMTACPPAHSDPSL
jgi:hypothetical protein